MPEYKKQVNVTQVMVGGSDIEDDQGRDLLLKKVATRSQLPATGESDGDTYLIIDEDITVEWDAATLAWITPLIACADNTITSTKSGIKVNRNALLANDYRNFTMQGWADLNQITLSLTGAEKDTIVIAPKNNNQFQYYWQGELITITGSKQITLPDIGGGAHANGVHYIYLDNSTSTLKSSTTIWDIDTTVQVAVVLWNQNNASGKKAIIADEYHSVAIPSRARSNLHKTRGTQISQRGTISGYTLKTATNAGVTFGYSQSIIADEDIEFTLPALVDGNGTGANYDIFFRDSSGNWTWNTDNNFPFVNAVNGRIQRNTATGLVECGNNTYINAFLVLNNFQSSNHALIFSSKSYTSGAQAYNEDFFSLGFALPFPEYYVVGQITFLVSDTNSNTGKCTIERVISLDISSVSAAIIASSVVNLTASPIPGYRMNGGLSYNNSTTVIAELGIYEIGGIVRTRQSDLVVDWTMIDTGTTKQANKAYYVYAKEDPSNADSWVAFISHLSPKRDAFGNAIWPYDSGAKYHPTLAARFVGSFRLDASQNIVQWLRSGDMIYYKRLGYDFIVNGATTKNVKIVVDTSLRCPETSNSILLYYEAVGGVANSKYIGDIDEFTFRFQSGSGKFLLPLSTMNVALAYGTATGSSDAGNAFRVDDGSVTTAWNPTNTSNENVVIDFGSARTIDTIELTELAGTYNTTSFNLQYWNGSTWVTCYTGTTIGALLKCTITKVSTQKIRFNLLSASARIKIAEIRAYEQESLNCFYYQIDGDAVSFAVHGYSESF